MSAPYEPDERARRLATARASLRRSALIWTPFFLVTAGGALWYVLSQIAGGGDGGWVLPVILLAMAALCGFQALQALRDLRGQPRLLSGVITRHWSRGDLFVSRSHYLRLDSRQIVRVDKVQHQLVKRGDYVEVEYFPASMLAVTVEKRERPDGEDGPDEPRDPPPPEPPRPDPLLIERED